MSEREGRDSGAEEDGDPVLRFLLEGLLLIVLIKFFEYFFYLASAALVYYADAGELPKCQTLLAMGADVNHRLVEDNNDTPLHRASIRGRTTIVKLLIDNGALVNSKNRIGFTPLHNAAQEGHLAIAKLLVNSGARTDATQIDGAMPIHRAAQKNRHQILTYLVTEAEVSVNVVSTAISSCPLICHHVF